MTTIKPTPSDDEAVAIAAALQAALDRPVVPATNPEPRKVAWRFSGRWWSRPIPSRRGRPW